MPTRVPLIALKAHPYAKRRLVPGQPFDAESPDDAHILVTLGIAKRAAEKPAEPPRLRPQPLPVEPPAVPPAEPAATGEPEADEPRRRRTYTRRDLSAEE